MSNEEDIVRKVQALWRKVDDPAATEAEKRAAAEKARELMAKWAIDELVLSEASETGEPIVIGDLFLGGIGNDGYFLSTELVPDQRMKLAHYIAIHHRLRSIVTNKYASVDDDGSEMPSGKYLQLIGFRSDVAMTRALNQGLSADMIVAMSKEPTTHMTNTERKFYWMSFCDGYASRIEQRLDEVDHRVDEMAAEGSLLPVLANRKDAVDKFVDDMYGDDLKPAREKMYRFDPAAARRGAKAAERANIGLKGVSGNRGELK